MDKKTVLIKTPKGESEMSSMSGDMKRVMLLIDDKATLEEVGRRAPPSLRSELAEIIQRLLEAELVRDKDKLIVAPKLVVPKPLAPLMNEELDFTSMVSVPSAAVLAAEASKQKSIQESAEKLRIEKELQAKKLEQEAMLKVSQEAARVKAELEAAKVKSEQEASKAKADLEAAKARIEAEAKVLAEARAKHEAEAARLKAEQEAARLKIEQEAALRLKAEEAERLKREAEAARIKQQLEVERLKAAEEAAKAKAELEVVKARMEAEAKRLAEERARQEAEATRQKVEQEAARVKAEQEAISRAKAEAEEKIKKEVEAARVKEQQEQARIKAAQEAEKIKAELEEAKAKAEVEAKKLAEARAKQEAETARQRAEHEAARIKQEAETARQKAELEAARVKQEQESAERAARDAESMALKKQQEMLRQKAEEDVIKAKAELEAVKAQAELEAKALAEARVKQEAETARQKAEFDAAKAKVEEEKVEKSRLLMTEVSERSDSKNQQTSEKEVTSKDTFATRSGGFKIDLSALNIDALSTAPKVEEVESEDVQLKKNEEARLLAEQNKLAEIEIANKTAAEAEAKLKADQETARRNAVQEVQIKIEEQVLSSEQANAWAEAEQRAKLQANVQAEKVVQQAVSPLKTARARTRSTSIPIGKILFGLIFVSLIALFVLPLVWPMQSYIPAIEKRLSSQFSQTVKVGDISTSLLPIPSLSLKNVVIGQADEVKIESVLLKFDVAKIFADKKSISEAELSGVVLDGKTFEQSLEWLSHVAADEQYPIRHMTLASVRVATGGFDLPVLKGGVELSDNLVSRVVLHSEDEKMNIELLRENSNWQLSFGIKERSLPFVPQIIFSDFTAKGSLANGEVVINQIDGHAYDGILSGNGKVSWLKGWQVQGRFQAKAMELVKILPQYGVTGEVFADGSYNLQSANLAQLGETPKVEVTFSAKKGSINGVDVVETARLGSRTHLLGGRTHFDEFTGTLQIENHHQRYRQLKIASGMLSASGSMDVAPNDQLSGSLNAEIKMRAGSSALALSGRSVEPRLQAK